MQILHPVYPLQFIGYLFRTAKEYLLTVSINTIFIDKQNNTLSLTEIESGFLENRINRRQAGGSFHHFPAGVFSRFSRVKSLLH